MFHHPGDTFEELSYKSWVLFYRIVAVEGFGILILAFGHPLEALSIHKALLRAGFVNSVGEPPMLIKTEYDEDCCIFHFKTTGIALQEWTDNKEVIENALNITIGYIKEGKNKQTVQVYAAYGDYQFPEQMKWIQTVSQDPELVVGRSVFGNEVASLKVYPHFLIGGSTGSGKTVLLKFLLMQCVLKGYSVIIADFKGGVDYTKAWHEKYRLFIQQKEWWFRFCRGATAEIDGYTNFVFISKMNRNGLPMYPTSVRRNINLLVQMNEERDIQLPPMSPHILRHTAATRMAESGMELKTIQYLLGHSDTRTTLQVYNHVDLERARREHKKYDTLRECLVTQNA